MDMAILHVRKYDLTSNAISNMSWMEYNHNALGISSVKCNTFVLV